MTKSNVTQRQLYEEMVRLRDQLDAFKTWADDRFVSKEEFRPVQKVVYGVVGAFGLAIVGAIIALVIAAP